MISPNAFYHSPPPTSNKLDARQRNRLIRTTRKLGAVLGTTPQLFEHDPTTPTFAALPIGIPARSTPRRSPLRKTSAYAKRRQGSVFQVPPCVYDSESSASSSASSLFLPRPSVDSTTSVDSASSLPQDRSFTRHVREKSRTKGKRAPQLPTPLVLRLNAVPLPPSDPRVQPITPDTSTTIVFATPSAASAVFTPLTPTSRSVSTSRSRPRANAMLPTTPTTPVTPTATETRRRRLAKLKRTLGDNVPPELILPLRSARARQPSSGSPTPTAPSPPSLPHQSHSAPASVSTSAHGRKKSQGTLPRLYPPSAPGAGKKAGRRRSLSVDVATASAASASASGSERSRTSVEEAQTRTPTQRRPSRVWVTGAGTWVGEWNRRDIREVQQQLRALRVR
ncbi:hypothetical protein BD413DRAFT_561288 [Trametes elegans]|nr:hypothetical protein BD413DRAFT_561288 [Trametes elegans]